MATSVQICNRALSRSGGGRISALTDASREAQECNLHYEDTRDAVLRDFDWGFARKRATLALLTDTYDGWDYAYALPSDYIIARKLYDSTGANSGTIYDLDEFRYRVDDQVKYEIASNDAGSRPILLTDMEDAILIYTAKITDVNAFDTMFSDALAWRLASELAMSLRGKPDMQMALLQVYSAVVQNAKSINANEDYNKQKDTNRYIKAR